jgi:hypothetical protein
LVSVLHTVHPQGIRPQSEEHYLPNRKRIEVMMVTVQDHHQGSTEVGAVSVIMILRGTVQIVIVAGTRIGTMIDMRVITGTGTIIGQVIQIGMVRGEAVKRGTGILTEVDVQSPTEAGAGVQSMAELTVTIIAPAHLVRRQNHPTWQS